METGVQAGGCNENSEVVPCYEGSGHSAENFCVGTTDCKEIMDRETRSRFHGARKKTTRKTTKRRDAPLF